MKHDPISTRRLPDNEGDLERVGDFFWWIQDGRRTLVLAIPTTRGWCASHWSIDYANDCGAKWSWDGNEDAPTLSPSLHARGIWHGKIRAGVLTGHYD